MKKGASRGEIWVDESKVTKNHALIEAWKVLLPEAGPSDSGGHVLPDMVLGRPIAAAPGSVCSSTYLTAGPFPDEAECLSFMSYLRTRLFRFLVSLRKPSQHSARGVYGWVPQQRWNQECSDEELYAKYGITEGEQAYIAEMIREMPA